MGGVRPLGQACEARRSGLTRLRHRSLARVHRSGNRAGWGGCEAPSADAVAARHGATRVRRLGDAALRGVAACRSASPCRHRALARISLRCVRAARGARMGCRQPGSSGLTRSLAALTLAAMSTSPAQRRPSTSAPFVSRRGPATARERIVRALELGHRGRMLRKLGNHVRSELAARTR
jgi:hypothetical protein